MVENILHCGMPDISADVRSQEFNCNRKCAQLLVEGFCQVSDLQITSAYNVDNVVRNI